MLKETVYIEKPVEVVWDFVIMEFAKSFKTSPSKLMGKEIKAETMNFSGKPMTIRQTITKQDQYVEFVMESESGKDLVETRYLFEKDGETGTFLSVSEGGKGKESNLRSWNFKLMSLPILRGGAKKKLRRRLESIKMIIEDEVKEDDSSIESTEA